MATGVPSTFRNTVIVMTSNLGSDQYPGHGETRHGLRTQMREKVMETSCATASGPEFVNRIDEVVVFHCAAPIEQIQRDRGHSRSMRCCAAVSADQDLALSKCPTAALDRLGESRFRSGLRRATA